MKKIFTILFSTALLIALSACKTTECWVETQSDPIIIEDTLTVHEIHYHYKDLTGAPHCAWVPGWELPYTDTLHAHFYSWQKTKPCNCSE
jgi:hypothetical protein